MSIAGPSPSDAGQSTISSARRSKEPLETVLARDQPAKPSSPAPSLSSRSSFAASATSSRLHADAQGAVANHITDHAADVLGGATARSGRSTPSVSVSRRSTPRRPAVGGDGQLFFGAAAAAETVPQRRQHHAVGGTDHICFGAATTECAPQPRPHHAVGGEDHIIFGAANVESAPQQRPHYAVGGEDHIVFGASSTENNHVGGVLRYTPHHVGGEDHILFGAASVESAPQPRQQHNIGGEDHIFFGERPPWLPAGKQEAAGKASAGSAQASSSLKTQIAVAGSKPARTSGPSQRPSQKPSEASTKVSDTIYHLHPVGGEKKRKRRKKRVPNPIGRHDHINFGDENNEPLSKFADTNFLEVYSGAAGWPSWRAKSSADALEKETVGASASAAKRTKSAPSLAQSLDMVFMASTPRPRGRRNYPDAPNTRSCLDGPAATFDPQASSSKARATESLSLSAGAAGQGSWDTDRRGRKHFDRSPSISPREEWQFHVGRRHYENDPLIYPNANRIVRIVDGSVDPKPAHEEMAEPFDNMAGQARYTSHYDGMAGIASWHEKGRGLKHSSHPTNHWSKKTDFLSQSLDHLLSSEAAEAEPPVESSGQKRPSIFRGSAGWPSWKDDSRPAVRVYRSHPNHHLAADENVVTGEQAEKDNSALARWVFDGSAGRGSWQTSTRDHHPAEPSSPALPEQPKSARVRSAWMGSTTAPDSFQVAKKLDRSPSPWWSKRRPRHQDEIPSSPWWSKSRQAWAGPAVHSPISPRRGRSASPRRPGNAARAMAGG